MKIALATASNFPHKPDQEIQRLRDFLAERGMDAQVVPWDKPDIDWYEFDRVLIRSPWDYSQRLVEFLDWTALVASQTRLDNSREVVLWNCHKSYLADLEAAGVATVPTVYAEDAQSQPLAGFGSSEVVLKPSVAVGAIGALRCKADSAEAEAHLEKWLQEGMVLIQPLVPSVLSEGEISLIYFGGEYSHAVRKRPKAGDFRVQEDHGGSVEAHDATLAERELAVKALAVAPDPPLYARVDMVYWENAPAIIELELIEPELFFRTCQESLNRLADRLEIRRSADS